MNLNDNYPKHIYERYINQDFVDTYEAAKILFAVKEQWIIKNQAELPSDLLALYKEGPEWNEPDSWFNALDIYEDEILEFCYETVQEIEDEGLGHGSY